MKSIKCGRAHTILRLQMGITTPARPYVGLSSESVEIE